MAVWTLIQGRSSLPAESFCFSIPFHEGNAEIDMALFQDRLSALHTHMNHPSLPAIILGNEAACLIVNRIHVM
jgi:hypothetical protein